MAPSCWQTSAVAVSVDELSDAEWPAALSLVHRAFVDESFTVEMYGDDRLTRWGQSWGLYAPLRRSSYSLALGARLEGVLVGVLIGSTPGGCYLCQGIAQEPKPSEVGAAIDWQFHQNIAAVHAPLATHAWVGKVATETALHGLGIGRILLDSAGETLAVKTPIQLVLECAPTRAGFYTSAGFEPVTTFADPAGPDALLMRRWVR